MQNLFKMSRTVAAHMQNLFKMSQAAALKVAMIPLKVARYHCYKPYRVDKKWLNTKPRKTDFKMAKHKVKKAIFESERTLHFRYIYKGLLDSK